MRYWLCLTAALSIGASSAAAQQPPRLSAATKPKVSADICQAICEAAFAKKLTDDQKPLFDECATRLFCIGDPGSGVAKQNLENLPLHLQDLLRNRVQG